MSIDLSRSFGLSAAARKLPPHRSRRDDSGETKPVPVHPATLARWVTTGVRGPDGTVVRLEAVRLGGRWVTDDAALARFSQRLTPDYSGDDAGIRTPTSRSRSAEAADKALVAAGF
jgi:hypothetical protein